MSVGFNSFNSDNKHNQAAIKARYDEVYRHEMAHKVAAGVLGGSIVIDKNADGWATGGHVDITIPGLNNDNPEETKMLANQVIASALAPSDPSGQDYRVAAKGRELLAMAQEAIDNRSSQGSKLDISA